jgi:hypothetical protein
MKERDVFSWIALVLVVVGEAFAFFSIHGDWHVWGLLALLMFLFLIELWIIGRKYHHKFGIRSVLMTKLLANAIVPRALGTLYLFLFVIHIGWLTNAVMSLFMPSDNFSDVLIATGICLAGLSALVVFFPNSGQKKDDYPIKIFISGISSINYKNQNLLPIVRMLQLTNDDNDHCELLILHSSYYSNPNNDSWVIDNFANYYNATMKQIKDETVKQDLLKEFTKTIDITEKLRLLIKIIAITEFPQKKWILSNLQVTFSQQCDYESFEKCFDTLDKIVRAKDNSKNQLFFNITPGTVNVGALMTLMAIDGHRKLYYYIPKNEADKEKTENEDEKKMRLVEVKKSDIPLQNLLSQALDSFETDNNDK